MNLGQFRTSVDRRTGVAVDQTTQNEWVNFVLAELALEENWPWLEKSTTVTLVANQTTYSLPSDCRSVFSVVNVADSNVYDEASIRDVLIFSNTEATPNAQFGYGYFYALDGMSLYLAPTPAAAGSLTVRYWGAETTLSADGDSPLLPSAYHQSVVELVAYLVMGRRASADDGKRAAQYSDLYKKLVGQMKREALRRTGTSRMPRIRPGSGW